LFGQEELAHSSHVGLPSVLQPLGHEKAFVVLQHVLLLLVLSGVYPELQVFIRQNIGDALFQLGDTQVKALPELVQFVQLAVVVLPVV